MKPLSPEVTAVMQEILSGISNVGDTKKLDNNPTFMPLFVECIGTCKEGKLFSLAHYGVLNGDPMRDPDMVFLERITPTATHYYPVSYRNDYAGYFQECIVFEENRSLVNIPEYLNALQFAEMWLNNIRQQQLKIEPITK